MSHLKYFQVDPGLFVPVLLIQAIQNHPNLQVLQEDYNNNNKRGQVSTFDIHNSFKAVITFCIFSFISSLTSLFCSNLLAAWETAE